MNRRGIKPRTFGISLLFIFVLTIWLKNTYDDMSWVESDLELCKISSMYKDTNITNLSKKIDSLNNQIKKLKTPFIVYIPIKPVYKPVPKIDSIVLDTIPTQAQIDTLNSQ